MKSSLKQIGDSINEMLEKREEGVSAMVFLTDENGGVTVITGNGEHLAKSVLSGMGKDKNIEAIIMGASHAFMAVDAMERLGDFEPCGDCEGCNSNKEEE